MNLSLSEIVQDRIREEGPMSFRDFMEMALYYPELGYYASANEKFGMRGDYFTAPFLTSIYGSMIAKQLEEMWHLTGKKDFAVVEYGAGTGSLCVDILKNLKHKKQFYKKIKYYIIEKSEALREKQKELFDSSDDIVKKISWTNDIEEISPFTGCVLANEVLDNFSVHKVVVKEKELQEVFVEQNFTEILKPAGENLKNYFSQLDVELPNDFYSEVNLEALEWLKKISYSLQKGFVITIDYGFPSSEMYKPYRRNGTILCYFKHTVNDQVYNNIGDQDITSHVNFSALDIWGKTNGLNSCGFTDQSQFLLGLGLTEHLRKIETTEPNNSETRKHLASIYTLLISMGKKFKVLIQQKGLVAPKLIGLQFSQHLQLL